MDRFRTKAALRRPFGLRILTVSMGLVIATACVAAEEEAGKKILLKKEPKGAVDVVALRKEAKDQQEVVVVGRIGGRSNPWVKGIAAFPIVDRHRTPCNEMEGDTCKTPWDYCCEANLPQATVLVLFVDENGKMIKQDPRTLFGVKELQTVVVKGKAKRDKAGNVTVYASQLHVRQEKQAKE